MIKVEISGSSELSHREIKRMVRAVAKRIGIGNALISIAFVSSGEIKRLNRIYRNRNKPTDVLSFGFSPASGDEKRFKNTGELIISRFEAKINAKKKGIAVSDEVRLLIVHGVLHLAGYDHETKKEEKQMFALQNMILKSLR